MKRLLNYLAMAFAAFVFALGFNIFLYPANIAPGGVTGISLLINFFLPALPIGTVALLLNLPLFIIGARKLGREFVKNTIFTTILSSVFLDLLSFMPPFNVEPLLSAIYGGVLLGFGIGIAFLLNSSTGGIDIIVRVLQKKYPNLSLGRLMLIIDSFIALAAGAVYRNLNNALYAVIAMYVTSLMIDTVLYGANYAKAALVITEKATAVSDTLIKNMSRGTTLIPCIGGYSNSNKTLILCAIRRNQIAAFKTLVNSADPSAFVILAEAHEVLGHGFKNSF